MHRFAWFALSAAIAFGQPNNPFQPKPPAKVDAALRARVKDFFYSGNKPKYLTFEISRIDYSADFTRAKVLVMCEQYIMMPGFSEHPMKVPTPSTWKLENGKWDWYVDQDGPYMPPAGKMTSGPFPGKGG